MKLTKNDISIEEIDSKDIWIMLEDFAHYAFNKSHAVSYSQISYWTAKLWANNKDQFLEFIMNNSKSDKVKLALNKAKEMGYKVSFPDYHNIVKSNKFFINNKIITPPIDFNLKYDYLSDFLFSEESKITKNNMILRGVMDNVIPDRKNLVELIKAIPNNMNYIPQFPQTDKFNEILRNGELFEIWKILENNEKYCKLSVIKPRSTKEILIYKSKFSLPSELLEYNIKQDIKHFGIVRDNQLSNTPNLNLENMLRKTYIARSMFLEGKDINNLSKEDSYKLKELIKLEVGKAFYDPKYRKVFDLINDSEYIVIIKEIKYSPNYDTTKVTLTFNNEDISFWLRPRVAQDIINQVNTFKKGQMKKVKLMIDSYINKNYDVVVQFKIRTFINE